MKKLLPITLAAILMTVVVYGQKVSQGEEFQGWMKDIQANVQAYDKAYESMDMKAARAAIDALVAAFTKVETHFTKQNKKDAIEWSKDARTKMETAQSALRREDIAMGMNLIQWVQKDDCTACHNVYRK